MSSNGLLLQMPLIGPYNTGRLIVLKDDLYGRLVPREERGQVRQNLKTFVIVWDNVAFHHARALTEWFEARPPNIPVSLPPYSAFLNPIEEEFFSSWRWKVYDHRSHEQISLLNAMNTARQEISAEDCQGWIRHSKRFFPQVFGKREYKV